MTRRWTPGATYRLQLRKEFTFDDARAQLAYLECLGVDTVYTSPFLKARAESTHGYDVSDHSALNPALGGQAAFDAFVAELRARGMSLLVDLVPNHMGIGEPSNQWWTDVLENGPSSIYADYFDVDWRPIAGELHDRVLLPILGDRYGRVLEDGQLRLAFEDGAFFVYYYDTKLPVSPRSYDRPLQRARDLLGAPSEAGYVGDESLMELESIITAARNLPSHQDRARERRRERHRETEVLKRRLAALVAASQPIAHAIETTVAEFNGRKGDPRSFDRLDDLLNAQSYRLAYWRTASEEINYRRFFDVNDLAAIRMENAEVFELTHRLLLDLLAQGKIDGFRIDHPDGLWDPAGYFDRLQDARRRQLDLVDGERPLYVVVEKILAPGENLPSTWPVDGTVGYEFVNALNGLFVDARNRRRFDQIYRRFAGATLAYDDLVYQCKRLITQVALASETNTLALELKRIAERNRLYRDFPLYNLRFAIREVIACFPVYRTYVDERTAEVDPRDRAYVEQAIARARRRNPAIDRSVFDFLRDLLLLQLPGEPGDGATLKDQRRFVMMFQQCTGPISARGVEDTAFYVYARLASLNEVGGAPDRFGVGVDDFHHLNLVRARDWPHGLSTTSTHDTKRSEDVRARIDVLSEMPNELSRGLTRWSRRNRRKRRVVDGRPAPDRNEEYLLYQTLLGAWPLEPFEGTVRQTFVERIVAYMAKATKEAKKNTSWINPNEEWDAAVGDFVRAVLADEAFVADFLPLQRRVAHYGMYNALAQTLLKIASPGVPDVYQGQELWDYSLVDPDNRRPVDYARRSRLLAALQDEGARLADPTAFAADLIEHWSDSRIKLWVTHRALDLRRRTYELFREGDYRPLYATGNCREHVVAFARTRGDAAVIALAPRLVVGLTPDPARPPLGEPVWGAEPLLLEGHVPAGRYRDVLTERTLVLDRERLMLAEALAWLPVALLERIA